MAVGALAALAVARGVQPRKVPAILAQSQLVTGTSAIALASFGDVPREAGVAWGDVQIATTRLLMTAADAGAFVPTAPLLRGPAATLVKKLFALPDYTGAPTFADVPPSAPDYAGIEAIATAGLTSGCGGGNFCPDQPLQRGQMAIFVVKALGLDPLGAPAAPLYGDVTADAGVTAAEFPFVQLFGQAALLDPCGPALFCPTAPLTRAQAAQVVRRTLVWTAPLIGARVLPGDVVVERASTAESPPRPSGTATGRSARRSGARKEGTWRSSRDSSLGVPRRRGHAARGASPASRPRRLLRLGRVTDVAPFPGDRRKRATRARGRSSAQLLL